MRVHPLGAWRAPPLTPAPQSVLALPSGCHWASSWVTQRYVARASPWLRGKKAGQRAPDPQLLLLPHQTRLTPTRERAHHHTTCVWYGANGSVLFLILISFCISSITPLSLPINHTFRATLHFPTHVLYTARRCPALGMQLFLGGLALRQPGGPIRCQPQRRE